MLEISATAHRPAFPNIPNLEFLRIELSPALDGRIFVALTATTVDEEEPQLLDQEIASDHAATIDDALLLITQHARAAFSCIPSKLT